MIAGSGLGPKPTVGAGRDRGRNRLRPDLLVLEDRRLLSTFAVNSTADDGSNGTLRWAVAQANGASSPSAIELELGTSAATIALAQGQLALSDATQAVTIYDGPGQGPVSVSGNNAGRVFQVNAGVTATITGLTIAGGSTSGSGGGLYVEGTLNMTGCTVTGNSAAAGGGLAGVGRITMTDSTITGNSAAAGGGLYEDGSATLNACTITGNSAAVGGGIDDVLNGKIAGTTALEDTIVAANTGTGGTPSDIGGSRASSVTGTYNLIGTGGSGGVAGGTGDIVLTSLSGLGLGAPGNYGGTTQTVPLLPGSPALGTGAAISGLTTDQRGEPVGSSVDIGAFQSQGFTLTPVAGSTPQSTAAGAAFPDLLGVTVKANNAVEPVAGGVVSYTVNPNNNGASATLSAATAVVGQGGLADVGATANSIIGKYSVTASASGAGSPATFALSNLVQVTFSDLSSPSITYGTTSTTLTGRLSSGKQAPATESVLITVGNLSQTATIAGDGGFSATFDTAGLGVTGSPYTVTYSYTSDGTYSSASATGTLTVTPATPTVGVTDAGGTFNNTAFPATATVAGVGGTAGSGLEGASLSLAYYSGTYTTAAQLQGVTPLSGAPSGAGAYTVLASFPGSADYTSGTALANFSIAPATPAVNVTDSGGTFNAATFPATATVAGVGGTAGSSLEGASLSLAYYSGTYTTTAQLQGVTPLSARRAAPAPTRCWPASPAAPTTPSARRWRISPSPRRRRS